MIDPQSIADNYVAVWNETDAFARREAIAKLWAPDGLHYVRTLEAKGYDALEKRIIGSHEKNVKNGGFKFTAAKNAQALQDVVTFNWEMIRPASGEVVSGGLEFVVVDPQGRILSDYQFLVS